jgi:hypothetical protein
VLLPRQRRLPAEHLDPTSRYRLVGVLVWLAAAERHVPARAMAVVAVTLTRWDKGTTHFKEDITPAKLEKAKRTARRVATDDEESDKVKARSKGQCEVIEALRNDWAPKSFTMKRCPKRALHVHHLLGGIGVRGRGKSALAENKLHLCPDCHSDIHAHVLVKFSEDGKEWRRRT